MLLRCLDQMLAVMVFSQHRVSSSETVRPRIFAAARCVGHIRIMWSAVWCTAPRSQFDVGARLHLCIVDWKCPTPVRRRLSLTYNDLDKVISIGLVLVLGMKKRRADKLSKYSELHLVSPLIYMYVYVETDRITVSVQLAQTDVCILVSPFRHLAIHKEYGQGSGCHERPGRVSLLIGKAQPAGCLQVWASIPLKLDAHIQRQCAVLRWEHCQWGACGNCDTRLVRSTPQWSRPEIRKL